MKILFVVTQGEQGGAQKYTLDMVSGFLGMGHDMYVAVGEMENEGDKWLFNELKKVGVKNENLFEIKSHQREIKLFRDLKSLWDFVKLYRKIKPDIVHLNSSKAGVVGAIAGFVSQTKTVFTVHGFVFLEPMNFLKKIIFVTLEFISSLFRQHTILITEKDISVGKKYFILRSNNKYSLVYNGVKDISSEMLDKNSARKLLFEKAGIKDVGQKVVGTISNLYKTKGLEYLIEAAHLYGGPTSGNVVYFVLGFGEDKYRKELEEKILAQNLCQNFFLLGRTPNAFKYLKAFDLFTLTSVKEGLPYTLLEAKMAGLSIMATNVGGIPEMAKHIDINLVESKNVKEMAEKMQSIFSASSTHQNPSLPEIYKIQTCLDHTLSIYKKLL